MTGNIEFGGITKKRGQVYPAPAFSVLRAYATAAPHSLLTVQSDGPTYTVKHGIDRLTDIADVPYLDATAVESDDGKRLILFCVNRSLLTAANVALDLEGFHVAAGTMHITTLQADSIYTGNDEEHPDRIKPLVSMEYLDPHKPTHTLPNAGVTVLEIPIIPI